MKKYLFLIIFFKQTVLSTFAQTVTVQLHYPPALKGRKAILLTREKSFASTVHSIKLFSSHINLDVDTELLPDLYQLHVSQLKGSLLFFLEPGVKIQLDTMDVGRSTVTNSPSTLQWQDFEKTIQQPYEEKINLYALGEKRARKEKNADSLNYWVNKQAFEKEDLVRKTGEFIVSNPSSYVSLYLLKMNWYAFQGKGIFELMDPSMAHHKTFLYLKERNRKHPKT